MQIIVPVDLEINTQKLVEFAIHMANRLDGEIIIFHCVEFIELTAMGEMALHNFSYDDYNSAMVEHAEKMIQEIVQNSIGKCKKCHGKVVVGDTVDEIVEYAKNLKADMIIIGTHGRQALGKILLGSVADRVLKRVHCPVLVMNPYR